ncbi:MAG: TrbI/VirB10 family protein [Brevundimonas sp.]
MTAPASGDAEGEDVAGAMRLRADPPKVMRLSRKALFIGGGILGIAGGGLLIFALRGAAPPAPPKELYRPATASSEALNALPADYAGPRLGPPLPGDLGRPILAAGQAEAWSQGAQGAAGSTPSRDEDAAVRLAGQRREQERQARDAALASSLFVRAESRTEPGPQVGDRDDATTTATRTVMESEPASEVAGPGLWPGAVIAGALITGLRSDLPGPVLGQVTEDVRDSRSGETVVIPRGSRLIGAYDAEIAEGQARVRIVWSRLITPDGRTLVLSGAEASDAAGYAGLQDRVDNRWGERLRAAGLTTLLSISTAATEGDADDRIIRALRDGAARGVDLVGREVVTRGLSLPPRLTVRPGYPFHIILTEGLTLPPQGD